MNVRERKPVPKKKQHKLYKDTCLMCGEDNKQIDTNKICDQCVCEMQEAAEDDRESKDNKSCGGCIVVVLLALVLGFVMNAF